MRLSNYIFLGFPADHCKYYPFNRPNAQDFWGMIWGCELWRFFNSYEAPLNLDKNYFRFRQLVPKPQLLKVFSKMFSKFSSRSLNILTNQKAVKGLSYLTSRLSLLFRVIPFIFVWHLRYLDQPEGCLFTKENLRKIFDMPWIFSKLIILKIRWHEIFTSGIYKKYLLGPIMYTLNWFQI
jgi:hypothetical protein